MAIDRRSLLAGGLASAVVLPVAGLPGQLAGRPIPRFLTTARTAAGAYEAAILDADGTVLCSAVLPGRGHGGAWHPATGQAVVFARRPGTFALVLDARCGGVRRAFHAPADRHFYGHGVFSADGRLLFTTENDLSAPRGIVGVWDVAAGYERVGEFESGGIGPHDLALIAGGRTLVVANGGILTHPDTGRAKLNIADMDPNLAFLDAADGRLERALRMPREFHKLSIRHLAVGSGGAIGIATQYEGPPEDMPPLVLLSDGRALVPLEAPGPVAARMKAYCGDVAMDGAGQVMAVSSPRGNLVTFWSAVDRVYLGKCTVDDGCGVAPVGPPGRFLLTGGTGRRVTYDAVAGAIVDLRRSRDRQWDNHMATIT